jgi:hypothetical protein
LQFPIIRAAGKGKKEKGEVEKGENRKWRK